MKVLVATDAHILQTPDGRHWCKSIYGYSFWKRYLDVFDSVRIVARIKNVTCIEGDKLLVDGVGIEVFGIPFYQGPKQLAENYLKIHNALREVDKGCDVAIMRMPSQTAQMTYEHLRKGIPVVGEIVYDPSDSLNDRCSLFMRIIYKKISDNLKSFCMKANGVSYVTEYTIQNSYPSYARVNGESREHFETFYSSICLPSYGFTGARDYSNCKSLKLVLSSVAMNSERKGEKVLIEVVKVARQRGYDVSATLIGDGTLRKSFEDYAKELGIAEYVRFTGLLASADEVRKVMLEHDVFVFPTKGEGLPRGILEAMAVGMPVLSTPVGGIPEVIKKKYLRQPTDVEGFANLVCDLLDNPLEMTRMSHKNFEKSLEYSDDILQHRRNMFYKKLKDLV